MADEKQSGSASEGGAGNSDKGGRRRYFWRKKRGQKPGGEAEQPKEQPAKEQPSKEQAGGARRSTPKAASNNEKVDRDPRNKRRRRRPRSRQGLTAEPKVIAPVAPIEDDYVAPKSVFIYTHVVRPDQRDSYEFRADHFAKGGRRLEDFDLDLSLIFPEDGASKPLIEKSDDRPSALFESNSNED